MSKVQSVDGGDWNGGGTNTHTVAAVAGLMLPRHAMSNSGDSGFGLHE